MLKQPLRDVMTRWALRMRRPGGRRFAATAPRPSVITVVRPRLEEMEVRLAPAALIAPTPSLPVAVSGATASGGNDFSAPVVVADPLNVNNQVMVTQVRRSDGSVDVVGQYSSDRGVNWSAVGGLANRLTDHGFGNSFRNASQPSVSFGRDGIFYIAYVEHSDNYVNGVVLVQSYTFGTSGPGVRANTQSSGGVFANFGSSTQQVLYRWSSSRDAAYSPTVAVDNNQASNGAVKDTLVDPNSGAPKAVYVAFYTVATRPNTGGDNFLFNPNAVWASVSTDAGVSFTSPIAVNNSSDSLDITLASSRGLLLGPRAGYVADPSNNTGGGAPSIAFAPVTSGAPGLAVIGWAGGVGAGGATINYDMVSPDNGLAAGKIGSARTFSRVGTINTVDAIRAVDPSKFDTPQFTDYPLAITDLGGLDGTELIANLTATVSVRNRDLSTISAVLIDPDGNFLTLFTTAKFSDDSGTGFGLPAGGSSLGFSGSTNGVFGTTFDDYAARRVTDTANAYPLIGTNKTEFWNNTSGALSKYAGKPVSYLASGSGKWTLRVTDFRNDRDVAAANAIDYLSLSVTAQHINAGNRNQSLVAGMAPDAKVPDPSLAGGFALAVAASPTAFGGPTTTGSNPVGVSAALSIAFDTSFKPANERIDYSPGSTTYDSPNGQMFIAYTSPALDSRGLDVKLARAVLVGTATGGSATFDSNIVRVNDDTAADNFSEGTRSQFQPTLAVDPSTGTVGVMWYDARYDAGLTRAATYLALSIDGGVTFRQSNDGGATPGAQIYLNRPRTATDAIAYAANGGGTGNQALSTVTLEPIPAAAAAFGGGSGALGFGGRQSLLAIAPGKFAAYWTGNQDVSVDRFGPGFNANILGSSVFRSVVTGAAGPRVVTGDMGPVGQATVTPQTKTASAGVASAANTLHYFVVTFDRPVDRSNFTKADVQVQYRSVTGTVRNLVAGTDFGDPVAIDAGGMGNSAARSFYVPLLIPQTAVGTYSYSVGPAVLDLLTSIVPATTFTDFPTFITATPYSGGATAISPATFVLTPSPSVRTPVTSSFPIVVAEPGTGLLVRTPRVTIDLNKPAAGSLSDLTIDLVGPDGRRVRVFTGAAHTGGNSINAEFRDFTDSPVGVRPLTGDVIGAGVAYQTDGEFIDNTQLKNYRGAVIGGTWTLRITNSLSNDPTDPAGFGPAGVLNAWGISFTTVKRDASVPSPGNAMDQNNNGLAAQSGDTDAFANPRPSGRLTNPTAFPFPSNYDQLTSPLIITGPRYLAPVAERLFLNQAVSSLNVAFDRPMNPATFDADGRDILRITGPTGVVFDQAQWKLANGTKAYPVTVAAVDAQNFTVAFTAQVLSGNYNVEFGPDIQDASGNPLDTNRNAGVAVLRGGDPTAGVTVLNGYDTRSAGTAPVVIPSGQTVSMSLSVPDSFTLFEDLVSRIKVTFGVSYPSAPDLVADLVAPDGTAVRLFTQVGLPNQANFTNTTLDDGGSQTIQSGAAPFSFGPYTPQFPLSALRGLPSNVPDPVTGLPTPWKLRIQNVGTGTGTINFFTLSLPQKQAGTGLGEAINDRFTVPFRIFTQDPTNKLTQQVFTPVGPAPENGPGASFGNNSSRITGVAVDPSDASGNTVYAGGASGGIFKTTNFLTPSRDGPNWQPLTDFGPTDSLNTGSITVFPRNGDPNQSIIFALTGEGDTGTGGVGVLRSVDGGRTWKVLDSTHNADATGAILPIDSNLRDRKFFGSTGFKIIVDPTTVAGEVIVYIAVSGTNGGVYRSNNSGRDWTLVRAGNATDVFLAAGLRSTSTGSAGTLSFLYAAFAGDGVYVSPSALSATTMSSTNATNVTPNIRNVDGTDFGLPVDVPAYANGANGPNGARGRIQIVGPSATGDVLQDTFYAGWLYAIVSTAGGSRDGLYVTKDFGRNWTKIHTPVLGGFPTNNEARADQEIFAPPIPGIGGQGNYNINIAIDPTNPDIVYVGGLGNGNGVPLPAGGLLRVDVSGLNDAQAFTNFDNSSATQTGVQSATVGGIRTTGAVLGSRTPNANIFNLSRNPDAPFDASSVVRVTGAQGFTNTGENAKYSGFTDFLNTADTHRLISFRDQLTGKARLVITGDHQIATGVDDGSGRLVKSVGTAASVSKSRNGNLQLFQAYSGAAQPSQLAVDLAQAFLYGMGQDNGFPVSGTDVLSAGNLSFTGSRGDGAGVAVDPTGSGTAYQYRWPCCGGGLHSEFFRVLQAPSPGFSGGTVRTNGLIQTSGDDPQWPLANSDVGFFAVNPIDPQGILIGSAAGRLFRTTNQGKNWFVVAEPAELDGSLVRAAAYGAPDPTGAPDLNAFLYAGTMSGNVYVTFTGGAPWRDLSAGISGSLRQIVPDPHRGSHGAYAVTTNGVFYMADSSDAGARWVNISGVSVNSATGNLFDLRKPIFGDANNTASNPAPNGEAKNLRGLTALTADWRYAIPANPALPTVNTFPVLYAAGLGGVFRSIDRGTSWQIFPDAQDVVGLTDPVTGLTVKSPVGGNLPSVDVRDLDLSLGNLDPLTGLPVQSSGGFNMLTVSTYGRGLFAIRLETPAAVAQYVTLGQSGPRLVGLAANTTSSLRVRFDAPVVAATFDSKDVVLTNAAGAVIPVTSVTPILNPLAGPDQRNLFQINFTPVNPADTYTVTVGSTISDFAGFGMNQNGDRVNGDATLSKVTGNTAAGVFTPASVDAYTGTFVTVNSGAQPGNLFIDQVYSARAADPVAVKVTAIGTDGNPLTTFGGTVHFASATDAGAVVPPDYTFTASDLGSKVFKVTYQTATFVPPPGLSGTQSVSVTDTAAVFGSATERIVIRGGAAVRFDVAGIPASVVAGVPQNVTLTARDKFNNLADGFVGLVNFTSTDPQSTALNGGLPSGFSFAAADFGTKTLVGQVVLKTVGTQSVTANDDLSGLITGTQVGIVVTPAAASSFTVTGHATPVVAGSMNDFTVTAYDPFGNVATGYTGTAHFTTTDAQAGEPADYTFTSGAGLDNGVHTFVGGSQFKTVGTQTLTATDAATATVTGKQVGIVVTPAAAASFTVAGVTSPIVAGVFSNVDLVAFDPYGNIDTNYKGTVTFTSDDPQQVGPGKGLPTNYTFLAADKGHKTLVNQVSLRTVGTRAVTATDVASATVTGQQAGIVVTPAAANHFEVTGIRNPTVAGSLNNVSLTARDPFNNVDTNFVGDVTFFSSDKQVSVGDGLPLNKAFLAVDQGQTSVTDQVSLRTAGLQSVSAKDVRTGTAVGTQANILVTPAVAASLKLAGHRTPVVAGTASDFTATAFDRFGNVATGYTGTLRVTSSDAQAAEPGDYTFVATDAGAHTFALGSQLKTAGKQSVTATDTVNKTITASQTGIVVVAAAASQFAVSGHPASVVAGSVNGFTVVATDAFGNRASGYTGSVSFTSTDPLVAAGNGLPTQYTFSAFDGGSHAFAAGAQLKTAGSQSISATDQATGFTGAQAGIAVVAAAAAKLGVSGFPNPATAGAAGGVTVVALDPYGNQAGTYRGTVRFSTSDPLANGVGKGLAADYAFTAADNGVHAFANGATLKTAGLQSITATDTAAAAVAGVQSGILVTADVAAGLTLAGYPTPVAAGSSNPFTVTARDRFGNVATGYTGAIQFDSGDRQVGPGKGLPGFYTFTPADAGRHAFAATFKTAGTQSLTASDVVAPSLASTQSGIAVTAGALSRLTVAGYPSPVVAGLDAGLTVSAADAFGNPVSNFAGTVQFSTSDPQGVVPTAYTFTAADQGRKTFVTGFSLRTAGLQSIAGTVSGNAGLSASQANISVVPTAATVFKFSNLPNPPTALTPATFTVTAFDPFGNFAGAYNGDLALTSSDPRAVLTNPVSLVNGVGTGTVTFRTAGTQSLTVTDPNDPTLTGTAGGLPVAAAAPGTVDPGSLNPLSQSNLTAVGTDAGVPSLVRVLNPDGSIRNEFTPYDPSFLGGVRVGLLRTPFGPRVVTAPGGGLTPDVRVFDPATGKAVNSFLAFEASFTGGVFVTTGDINNDGYDDIVLSPDNGGGPRVRILDGKTLATLADFFGIDDPNFRGGARSTLTDVNGDGVNDLVVAAGFGGGPRVAIYDGRSVLTGDQKPARLVADFFAFEPELRNGAYVAGGDVNGDGFGDLAFGAGPGGGPRVRVVNGKQILLASPFPNLDLVPQAQIGNFFSGDVTAVGGVRVAMKRLSPEEGVGSAVVTGSGAGSGTTVRAYPADQILNNVVPSTQWEFEDLPGATNGVFVG